MPFPVPYTYLYYAAGALALFLVLMKSFTVGGKLSYTPGSLDSLHSSRRRRASIRQRVRRIASRLKYAS